MNKTTTSTLHTLRTTTQQHYSTCLKRFASSSSSQSTSPARPERFLQTIVLSNGATFTVRTTSPLRSQIRLTKDTRNHPLWNPSMLKEGVTDESEQLTKFQKRFGDTDLADISWIESEETVSAAMKKVIASGGTKITNTKGKGKKK